MVFDQYVGLRIVEARPCWKLVRRVLFEQARIDLPTYDEDDAEGRSIESRAADFVEVPLSEAKPLDVAILFTDVRCGLGWKSAPVHIGVFVDAKRILHIEEGVSSRVQPASDLRIHSIVRIA